MHQTYIYIYTAMHHFVTETCTHVHISVTKWCNMGYDTDAFWDLWDGRIGAISHTSSHYSNVTCSSRCIISPAPRLLFQGFVQANNKNTYKQFIINGPSWGKSNGNWWLQRASNAESVLCYHVPFYSNSNPWKLVRKKFWFPFLKNQ